MECRPEMLSFFILYYLCLRVHHNIFPPLLPSLYEPSWDFAHLHIQHDELPKGRGANIVAEPIYHVKIFKNQKINSKRKSMRGRRRRRRSSSDMLTVQQSWINWSNWSYDSLYRSSNSCTALTAVTANLSCDSLYRSSNCCRGLTAVTALTGRRPKAVLI